jgi:hypothetical protein
MSSFFGTPCIYSFPEDKYWSSGIVVYKLNLLSNNKPFLVEILKMTRPLFNAT